MKKICSLLAAATLIAVMFTACGEKIERVNYKVKLDSYVTLCDLDAVNIDKNGEEFASARSQIESTDLENVLKAVKEGTVEDGDSLNIDYVGKCKGVAFTGGTASDQTLVIGSGRFIPGFEDALIGKEIGTTVDIDVTFPDGYNDSTDLETGTTVIKLANQPAVFTVTINYAERSFDEINEEFAKEAGYESLEAYNAYADEIAYQNCVYKYLCDNSTVNSLPDDKYGNSYAYWKAKCASQYGVSFDEFLNANSMTEAQFKKEMLSGEVIMYAAFDKLGLTLESDAIENWYAEVADDCNASLEQVKEYYTENYAESAIVWKRVVEKLAPSGE